MEFEQIHEEPITLSVIEANERAAIDMQISTAKRYPRNIAKVKENIVALVTMDVDAAKTCGYALPRGNKTVTGPTVHLAKIILQQYGNVRVEGSISNIDGTHVTSIATCLDLENNVGIRISVKRRITDKHGARFNDDMITVTGNAATSIAIRNAVFSVVPKALVDVAYKAAQSTIVGDISDENKLIAKRKAALDMFLQQYGVDEATVLKALGLREITEIRRDALVILAGIHQAIQDGDTTVDMAFYPEKSKGGAPTVSLDDLQGLYDLKKDVLSKAEQKDCERILKNQETNSYNKLHEFLKGK